MVQGHLAADEAQFLGFVGTRARGVEGQLVADRAAQHGEDRLLAQAAQQIPQRQIDAGYGVHDQTLAAVILGREIHLVPDLLDLGRIAPLQETGQVFFDDIGGGFTTGGHRKADHAVLGLDLDDQGAQHIDAEAAAALAVLGVFGHRRGDVVVDPVAVALVMIVGAPTLPVVFHDEGADVLDLRQAAHWQIAEIWRSIPIMRDFTGVSPCMASKSSPCGRTTCASCYILRMRITKWD
ncbi:hypothetical protein D3C86_1318650 [compost metagenome]